MKGIQRRADRVVSFLRPEDPWAYGVYALLVLALLVFFLLPRLLVSATDFKQPAGRLSAENDVRTTGVQLLAGFVLVVGSYFTARSLRINREGQMTERFTAAIEHLGSGELAVRLGGIYALERLGKNSPDDYPAVIEVLTAFVREHSPRPPVAEADDASAKLRPDVQAILSVLRRRTSYDHRNEPRIDLSHCNLRGAQLSGILLANADLRESDLSGADLGKAELRNADLRLAKLEFTELQEAKLVEVNLEGAEGKSARMHWADLRDGKLSASNFEGAIFQAADMRGANLTDAELASAIFGASKLEGAIFFCAECPAAKFQHARMRGASLAAADCSSADFSHADLREADLTDADCIIAKFDDADLTGANTAEAKGIPRDA